ncbi:metallo-beta-lactamase domain protein [delta proteobacterium NaphS2]|nr:metallo-beta-lactamase domain protein [delta proteobacterium NaphS2]
MKQITESVFFIPGQDEMIPDSHVYLLGAADSKDLSLIDAGLMGKGRYKIESIQESGVSLSDIKRIIMTHTHLDHIGCLGQLRDAIPHAALWIHESEAAPLENGDENTVYGMNMFESMCQTQYGIKPGDFCFLVDRKLAGGEALEIGGATWQVIHIPGHSAGSIALYDSANNILIPGDTVYADHAIGRFDLHGASGPQLKNSLLALADLDVNILLPGHNRIMMDVPAGYIRQTAEQWGPYLS